MRLRSIHTKLASLLLISVLMVAAGCQDEDVPGLVGTPGGRGGTNATPTPTPSPSPTDNAGGNVETGEKVETVTVVANATQVNSTSGGSVQLGVQIRMSNGDVNTSVTKVDWSTSNSVGVTVDNLGLVSVPPGTPAGDVTITATAKGTSISGTTTISVVTSHVAPTVQRVDVTPSEKSFESAIGGTVNLTASVKMSDNSSNANVTWSIAPYTGVSINNGTVTVASGTAPGTIKVTATSTQNTAIFGTATITVTPSQATPQLVEIITIGSGEIQVGPEGHASAMQLEARVKMSDDTYKTLRTDVTWQSLNTARATVDDYGLVAIPAGATSGPVTIQATAKDSTTVKGTATLNVTIVQPAATVTSMTLSPSTATIVAGSAQNTVQLDVTKYMSDSTELKDKSDVNWSVTAGGGLGVTVSSSGLVTVGSWSEARTYTITATHQPTGKTASAVITVKPAPNPVEVTITPGTATIKPGQSVQLTAKVKMSDDSENQNVTWESDEPLIAAVSSSGLVTVPHTNPGTATIKATSSDSNVFGTATITVTTTGRVIIIVE